MNAMTETAAREVISKYEYISKIDFLKAVKALVGKIQIDIKALCQLWSETYRD